MDMYSFRNPGQHQGNPVYRRGPYGGAYAASQQMGFNPAAWQQAEKEDARIYQGIPGSNVNYQTGEVTNAPAKAPQSPFDQLYGEVKAKQDTAQSETIGRYNAGSHLLNLDDNGNPLPAPRVPKPGDSDFVVDRSFNNGVPLTVPTFEGASPSEAAVNADAARRGIYNLSNSQNYAILGKTIDGFNASTQTFDRQYGAMSDNRKYGELGQDRADQLRREQVAHLGSRNDIPPDENVMTQLAMKYGAGSTDGLSPGAFTGGGGYGGGAMAGGNPYGLPMSPGYSGGGEQQKPSERSIGPMQGPVYRNAKGQADIAAQEKLAAYRKSVGSNKPGSPGVPVAQIGPNDYGVRTGPDGTKYKYNRDTGTWEMV